MIKTIEVKETDIRAIIGLLGMGCVESAKESLEKILKQNGRI